MVPETEMAVTVNADAASRIGLTPAQVSSEVSGALLGVDAGEIRLDDRSIGVRVRAPDSVRFNPLLEIRRGLQEVKDTQNVADILVDPTGEKETKDHWQASAHALLVGTILHVLYAQKDKTLSGVATFLSDPARSQTDTLKAMLATLEAEKAPKTP